MDVDTASGRNCKETSGGKEARKEGAKKRCRNIRSSGRRNIEAAATTPGEKGRHDATWEGHEESEDKKILLHAATHGATGTYD